jgi:hypothetical protein
VEKVRSDPLLNPKPADTVRMLGRNFPASVRFNYMCYEPRIWSWRSTQDPDRPKASASRTAKEDCSWSKDGEGRGDSKLELSTVVTNAKMTWSELLVLNGRAPDAKREALETSLDHSILALRKTARLKKRIKESEFQTVMDTLRCIRDYRLRFPRSNAANHKLSVRAQVVLDEL